MGAPGIDPLGSSATEYAIAICPSAARELDRFSDQDLLGDDLEPGWMKARWLPPPFRSVGGDRL